MIFEQTKLLISTDFETGNGKNIICVGDSSFRVEAEGDNPGYNWYFALCVKDRSDIPRKVTIEVVPDPDYLGSEGCDDFYGNLNTHLWVTKLGNDVYYRFPEFNYNEPGHLDISRNAYQFSVMTVPGKEVKIANSLPLPYSLSRYYAKDIAEKNPDHVRLKMLGNSFRGNPIHFLEIGESNENKPCVLIIAGEHAMEFPGQWATWGIIRWLTSSVREAVELRQRMRFIVFPTFNPDGNTAGWPQKNAQDIDLCHSWPLLGQEETPAAHENQLLWEFIQKNTPAMYLNFHGYPGPRAWGDWPYEGCYVPKPESIPAGKRNKQNIVNDLLFWETDAASQHRKLLHGPGDTLYEILPRIYGTVCALYEPSDKGVIPCMKTGVQVLQAILRGYESSI